MDTEKLKSRILHELNNIPFEGAVRLSVEDLLASTNSTLTEMAKEGAPDGTVLIALSQSHGKGRMGRSFYSPPMSGLYISFLFRPTVPFCDIVTYTPAAAVFTARAIEKSFALPFGTVQIKWVNDLYYRGKKICGILTEGAMNAFGMPDYAVLGIGINLTPPQNGFPPELSEIAGSVLETETDSETIYPKLCALLIAEIVSGIKSLSVSLPLEEYKSRCFFLGRKVTLSRGSDLISCHAVDIDERFRLITRDESGFLTPRDSGEIRLKL